MLVATIKVSAGSITANTGSTSISTSITNTCNATANSGWRLRCKCKQRCQKKLEAPEVGCCSWGSICSGNTFGFNSFGFNTDGFNTVAFSTSGFNSDGFNTDSLEANGFSPSCCGIVSSGRHLPMIANKVAERTERKLDSVELACCKLKVANSRDQRCEITRELGQLSLGVRSTLGAGDQRREKSGQLSRDLVVESRVKFLLTCEIWKVGILWRRNDVVNRVVVRTTTTQKIRKKGWREREGLGNKEAASKEV